MRVRRLCKGDRWQVMGIVMPFLVDYESDVVLAL